MSTQDQLRALIPYWPTHADLCEQAASEIEELRDALSDLLPYAKTCVPNPISVGEENVIAKAERLIGDAPREELPNCVWRGAATPFADNH